MRNTGTEIDITGYIGTLIGGGAERVFVTLMNHFEDMGYSLRVVIGYGDCSRRNGLRESIPVHILGVTSSKKAISRITRYLKANRTKRLFVIGPENTVNAIIARRLLNEDFKIISYCTSTLSYEYKYAGTFFRRNITRIGVKAFYKKADTIVAQTNLMMKDLEEYFDIPKDKLVVIHNPLAKRFEQIQQNKEKEKNVEKADVLLFVGRLGKEKAIDLLLYAFEILCRKNETTELRIVGDGDQKEDLLKLSSKLRIGKRVTFVPFTDNIEDEYKNAKATVLCSYYEGMPNVLIESIACGTPVVSFDLPGGPADIIEDGINGYLAKYLDINNLAECMQKALDKEWDSVDIKNSANKFLGESILPKYEKVVGL
ncbi:MAG: glycosyltransferase [Lachnospiraceae bacterium]|nr:glycosyltransferase [Lachnospiraceae bacterium]